MVNYDTLTNGDYTILNQRYEYEQCYHPTEREIKKKSSYFLTYPRNIVSLPVLNDYEICHLWEFNNVYGVQNKFILYYVTTEFPDM
jgi:hypothetical protein